MFIGVDDLLNQPPELFGVPSLTLEDGGGGGGGIDVNVDADDDGAGGGGGGL